MATVGNAMPEPARYQTAADVYDDWREDVLRGTPPVLFPVGTGALAHIEIGPGLVTICGGAPGAGKTALLMQLVVDALRLDSNLRALVCNVEMAPKVLLERQLARLSGVSLEAIRRRRLGTAHSARIQQGLDTIAAVSERLCFVRPPFDLANVAASADDFGANIILLDYIQRIPPPGKHGDKRGSVNASMDYLRQFADANVAVLVVAAVSRTRDAAGRSSYDGAGLNLASFRESSELEFGADDAFMLINDSNADQQVILRHLKSRHGRARDLTLRFLGDHQHFESLPNDPGNNNGSLNLTLAASWNQTPAG